MTDTHHVPAEKQSQLNFQRLALPKRVEAGRHYATVLATTHGVMSSHGHPPPVGLQAIANQGFSERNAKTMTVLGALQMLAGFLAVAFQAVATGIENTSESRPISHFLGWGIWCGVVFLITGILGAQAVRKYSRRVVKALLIFSIISSIMVWVLIISAAINFAAVAGCPLRVYTASNVVSHYQNYSNEGVPAAREEFTIHEITDLAPDWPLCTGAMGVTLKAMDCLLIIIALFEFAAAITYASFCCRMLSCCRISLSAFVTLHKVSSKADNSPYGSSMQQNKMAQDPLVHDKSLPTYAMVTGPVLDAHLQQESSQEASSAASRDGASSPSAFFAIAGTALPEGCISSKHMANLPPPYNEATCGFSGN